MKTSRKIAVVVVCAVIITTAISEWNLTGRRQKPVEVATPEYLMRNLSPNPVAKGMEPVVLLQYSEKFVGNSTIYMQIAGVGTMLSLSGNRYCVVTVEHVFSSGFSGNYERPMYAVKVLRERTEVVSRELVNAKPFFPGKTGLVDLVVCDIAEKGGRIAPFSPHARGVGLDKRGTKFYAFGGDPKKRVVRSLISGKEFELLCKEEVPGTGMNYFFIDYRPIAGESGVGFVDASNNIFVLKGILTTGTQQINEFLKERGTIKNDVKVFSALIGAFRVNKN